MFPRDAVNFFSAAVDRALTERKDRDSVSLKLFSEYEIIKGFDKCVLASKIQHFF